jgi:hypothetical protein
MTPMRRQFAFALNVALLGVLAVAIDARAQAWLPAKGEGTVAVAVQSTNVKNHLLTRTPVAAGEIDSYSLMADLTYGLTDKIAVDFALPFVMSKYVGTFPHPGTNIDDGTFRGSFSDVRFAVRYNLTRGGVVITPYVGSLVPSHNYAFYGHAAPGARLNEIQVGAYAAKLFERGVPGMFISGRYAYGFVEKVLDISHNRSSADLEVGYFFSPAFRAYAGLAGQYTHGGIDFPPLGGLNALPLEQRPVHDVIQRVHYLDISAGAAYSITDSFDVFGSFSRLALGRNGHALNRGITVGASWSFSRKRTAADTITASAAAGAPQRIAAKREGSLVRCVCQKSAS